MHRSRLSASARKFPSALVSRLSIFGGVLLVVLPTLHCSSSGRSLGGDIFDGDSGAAGNADRNTPTGGSAGNPSSGGTAGASSVAGSAGTENVAGSANQGGSAGAQTAGGAGGRPRGEGEAPSAGSSGQSAKGGSGGSAGYEENAGNSAAGAGGSPIPSIKCEEESGIDPYSRCPITAGTITPGGTLKVG